MEPRNASITAINAWGLRATRASVLAAALLVGVLSRSVRACDTVSLAPTDDAGVASFEAGLFGDDQALMLFNGGPGFVQFVLLRFPRESPLAASADSVESATLSLTRMFDGGQGQRIVVELLEDVPWNEGDVDFANQPDILNQLSVFATLGSGEGRDEIDVTLPVRAAVERGYEAFAFRIRYSLVFPLEHIWYSKDGDAELGPRLVVCSEGAPPKVGVRRGSEAPSLERTPFETRASAGHYTVFVPEESSEAVDVRELEVGLGGTARHGISAIAARLWLDGNRNGAVDGADVLKHALTLPGDVGPGESLVFDPDLVIPPGSEYDLIVEVETNDRACPGETVTTTVTGILGVGASSGDLAIVVEPPPPVHGGSIEIFGGRIEKPAPGSGDRQEAQQSEPFDEPLVVRVSERAILAPCNQVTWTLLTPGSDLVLEDTATEIGADGLSRVRIIAGQKPGENRLRATIMIGSTTPRSVEFTVWVTGILLTAEHDGLNGGDVGTFIPGIDASNEFTAEVELGQGREPTQVLFELGDETRAGAGSGTTWRATFDMGALSGGATTMTVDAKIGADVVATETLDVHAIPIPGWFTLPGLSKTWQAAQERYDFAMTLPAASLFDWEGYDIPSAIELLGGTGNDAGGTFTAGASYHISGAPSFEAGGEFSTEIFGHEFEVHGSARGDFDSRLRFTGGEGTLGASVTFELPEKGASKTVFVYGVPITLAVDLGGSVKVYVNGTAWLSEEVELERLAVTPGVTLTVDLTLSASIFFGVAKLAFVAHPTADVNVTLTWARGQGTEGELAGSFVIPYEVVGSIFWGTISGVLYEGEFGPWTFGTGGGAAGMVAGLDAPSEMFIPSMSIDAGTGGTLLVRTLNTVEAGGGVNPELVAQLDTGSGFAPPVAITSSVMHWEMDPAVRFFPAGDGTALVVWTSNRSDPTLATTPGATLADILRGQDIDWSYFDGSAWTRPETIAIDDMADGMAALAVHPERTEALCVWLTDPDSTPALPGDEGEPEVESRTDWILRTSRWAESGGSLEWSAPVALDKSLCPSGACAVREPVVEFLADGRALLLYSQDIDGRPETVRDSDIVVAWWNPATLEFDAPSRLTPRRDAIGEDQPDLVALAGGDAIAAWHARRAPESGGDAVEEAIVVRLWDNAAREWGEPVTVAESAQFVHSPQLVAAREEGGPGTIVRLEYIGFDGYDGDVFEVEIDVDDLRAEGGVAGLHEPRFTTRQLTADDVADWSLVAAGSTDGAKLAFLRNDWTNGGDLSSDGLADGLNVAGTAPAARLDGATYDASTVDADDDGLVDELRVEVCGIEVLEAGEFALEAELRAQRPAADGVEETVARVRSEPLESGPGSRCLTLIFRGASIRNHGIDGPFTVAAVRLLARRGGEALLVAAVDEIGAQLGELSAGDFETVPLTWDRESYDGDADATLTLDDASFDRDPDVRDVVRARLLSLTDARGVDIALEETGPSTGRFEVSVRLASGADATLEVRGSDVVDALVDVPGQAFPWRATATAANDAVIEGGFVRGDVNADAAVDLSDAVSLLDYLFLGGREPVCADAADANDSGIIDLSDAVFVLGWLFTGGAEPPAPSPSLPHYDPGDDCGEDLTDDALECAGFAPCS